MAIVTALGRSLDNIMKSLIIVGWPIYAAYYKGEHTFGIGKGGGFRAGR